MNPHLLTSFRSGVLATLFSFPLLAFAAERSAPDTATQLIARQGQVTVAAVGPFVHAGTYRIQVATKLGQPDARLADGAWLYHGRRIEGSDAEGTLIVRFAEGRVQSLTIATPAVVAALRKELPKSGAHDLLAKK